MRILITITLLLTAAISFGQIKFVNLYSDSGDDYGHGIVQLEDSSYMVTGSSSSFGDFGSQAFLMHIDSMGNYLWSNAYGGSENDIGRRVMYKKNDGFYVAGYTNSMGNGAYDFYLFKTDVSGALVWENTYGGSGWERVYDAALTRDTGVIMVGETSSTFDENVDIYIVRTDNAGDTLWTKKIGGGGEDRLNAITQYDDSTFYVCGSTYIADSGYVKGLVMKINDYGDVLWADTAMRVGDNILYDIDIVDNQNELLTIGSAEGPASDQIDDWMVRYDISNSHAYITNWTSPQAGIQWFAHITDYGDGANRYTGIQYLNASTYQSGIAGGVGQYASNMAGIGWGAVINHPLNDVFNDLIPTSDGGAVLVGSTDGEAVGLNHCLVVKIGPNADFPVAPLPSVLNQLVSIPVVNGEDDGLQVFPNPASTELQIITSFNSIVDVRLRDQAGRLVYESSMVNDLLVDVSLFENGIYYLETQVDGVVSVRKVMVSH